MIDVVVGGATGRLGSLVCGLISSSGDMRLSGAVVSPGGGHIGRDICGATAVGPDSLMKLLRDADVYVDLTSPAAAAKVIAGVPETGANLVLGTTSVPAGAMELMARKVRECNTSALVSANFAPGVNVFWKTCSMLAESLPDYDIEVTEVHHSAKEDAPSGTAAEAVRRMQESIGKQFNAPRKEINIRSIREGDTVGDHTVVFAKNMERLELTHRASSREAFAAGCVESVRWMARRKDGKVHSMEEVLGL